MNEKRIEYLESLIKDREKEFEEKHYDRFSKFSTYQGNGIYEWRGIRASSPREVWLLGVLSIERIPYNKE